MSYTYPQFVSSLANRLAIPSITSPAFVTELPNIIDAAEQRCYREVDLLDARIGDIGNLTPNSRNFTLPTGVGRFVVVEQANVIFPLGTTNRIPLTPVSKDSLDAMWPSTTAATSPSIPEFFTMFTSQIMLVGPPPDAAYQMDIAGTARPLPLSASNQTTILSLYLPDLFFAAAMEIAAAYQKNFGASADDPKMAMSWRAEYDKAKESAVAEEFRKKFGGSAWSSMATPPEAQPARN